MKAGQRDNVEKVKTGELVAEKPDSVLVEAAIGGDADSFAELCSRYYPAMVAIAHSVLGEKDRAEDAAQQGFANAVGKLGQLKDKSKFGGWLAVICRNAALDMARSDEKFSNVDGLSEAAADSQQDGLGDGVRDAIGRLSDSAREVIYLRYYEGMSYGRICEVLGLSEQAVNGRLRRAKKKIAEYLKRNGFVEVRL
jgi:RNA polymerase sigma-70 factor (ECF subfamily)